MGKLLDDGGQLHQFVKSLEAVVARLSHVYSPEPTVNDAPRERVIDLVHLARQTLGDPGLEQEVLRIFAAASRSYCDGVRNAESSGVLKINLHSLKGASAGIGAFGLADIARTAEKELRETGTVCDEMRADIGFAVEETNTYISALLKD